MTGARHFAKENERRTRAALKEILEAPAMLARKYSVPVEDAKLAVMAHGVEIADKLAEQASANFYSLAVVSELYRALNPRPKLDADAIRCVLEAAARPRLPSSREPTR